MMLSVTSRPSLLPSQTTFPVTPSMATSPSMAFSPYLSHMAPGMGLMPELMPSAPLLVPGSPTGLTAMGNGTSTHKSIRTDKLEVRPTHAAGPEPVSVHLSITVPSWFIHLQLYRFKH